ncbi:eukaryotic translation initiation factor 3 subunit I-like [Panicum miliaceum]|uniref:Eukaryotic translation initiation factor 3 subunit I-like n=1 Tax=Panicum miliaceum TaxID=4540 RepID=A0A3L6PHM4_PANMI|nr:eukaryotic translation initiation factor 3 subunit I-like [Panicum miliaceum]
MKYHERPLAFLRNNPRRRRPRPHRLVRRQGPSPRDARTQLRRLVLLLGAPHRGSGDQAFTLLEARAGGELFRFDALARSLESATGDALKVVTTHNFMDVAPTTQVRRDADDADEATTVVLGGGQGEMSVTMKTTVLANWRLNSTKT